MSEQAEPKPEGGQPPVKELTGKIGKYEIAKPLGKGAMGMVYLAHDTMLERDVALKVMVAQIADDPELKKRFEREAKAVAKMTHPNVVMVFDLGYHTDGSPYIAMELLKGMDLQKAMRTPPPLSVERKVAIIAQVLQGLAHAHQAGIVHRDIKPANIFINVDGTVKIMDFGVARLTTASMTGTGNIVGTADYMSPEQVKGAHVDGRSDVFSVGCMLYELLTGKRPFHSDNLMAIFYKITHDEPNWDAIPGGEEYDTLLPILRKALSKTLEDRYQTAYDFAVDLRDYLKAHASGAPDEHALEGLVDLEAPPSTPPQPMTDVPGATLVTEEAHGATMELGRTTQGQAPTIGRGPGTLRSGAAPTVVGGSTRVTSAPTVAKGGAGASRSAPAGARPSPPPRMEPRAIAEPPGNPMLYVVVGGLAVALLGAGGYIYLTRQAAATPPPPETQAVQASTLPPATQAVATTVPPTMAPPPTFAEAGGKAAASMRSAQAAFKTGDYDKAIAQAQTALREDPGSADAQKVLENALAGQKAQSHFRAAESALGKNDFGQAQTEAEAGRVAAPWDARGPSLLSRIQEAQQRAQQQAAQQQQQQQQSLVAKQVTELLNRADGALSEQKYDAAINLYDEAIKLDPTSQRAMMGKSSSVQARALSQAAASGASGSRSGGGKGFQSGKTSAQSVETKAGGAVPDGFEETAGVTVKKGTQAAELPGRVNFEIDPDQVKAGDKYTVKIFFLNEGSAPIQIKDMIVTTTVNGRKASGPIPSLVKDVAPQQKAMILSLPDFWKEDTSSWSMEVVVRTPRGETYKNQVTWK
jgi:serine/threonine-protein kinase